MSSLKRFGISLDSDLLQQFDVLIAEKKYANRSEAIRDLLRDALIQNDWEKEQGELIGTITLIYDHHAHDLSEKLVSVQHDYEKNIISTMHIHLDHDNCLEVLAVKGEAKEIITCANELIGLKGIKHGKLVTSTSGKHLK